MAGFVLANGSDHEHAGYSWNAANPIVAAGRYRGLPNQRVDHLFLPQSGLERLRVKRARLVLEDACSPIYFRLFVSGDPITPAEIGLYAARAAQRAREGPP